LHNTRKIHSYYTKTLCEDAHSHEDEICRKATALDARMCCKHILCPCGGTGKRFCVVIPPKWSEKVEMVHREEVLRCGTTKME